MDQKNLLKYSFLQQLDQALQRDDRLCIVDKLDPKWRRDNQNSPQESKANGAKNCFYPSDSNKKEWLFNNNPSTFKNNEGNEQIKCKEPSSKRDTEASKEMNCDGANAENIKTMHTQEGN